MKQTGSSFKTLETGLGINRPGWFTPAKVRLLSLSVYKRRGDEGVGSWEPGIYPFAALFRIRPFAGVAINRIRNGALRVVVWGGGSGGGGGRRCRPAPHAERPTLLLNLPGSWLGNGWRCRVCAPRRQRALRLAKTGTVGILASARFAARGTRKGLDQNWEVASGWRPPRQKHHLAALGWQQNLRARW